MDLIDDPELAGKRKELSARLEEWMKAQGDKGAATEEIAHTRKAGARRNRRNQKK